MITEDGIAEWIVSGEKIFEIDTKVKLTVRVAGIRAKERENVIEALAALGRDRNNAEAFVATTNILQAVVGHVLLHPGVMYIRGGNKRFGTAVKLKELVEAPAVRSDELAIMIRPNGNRANGDTHRIFRPIICDAKAAAMRSNRQMRKKLCLGIKVPVGRVALSGKKTFGRCLSTRIPTPHTVALERELIIEPGGQLAGDRPRRSTPRPLLRR